MTLLELAGRCEKATGPDREIDGPIAETVEPWRSADRRGIREADGAWGHMDDGHLFQIVPAYTASLDAAMTLVSGTLYGVELASNAQDEWCCHLSTHLADGVCERAATKELALCAAALRARGETL